MHVWERNFACFVSIDQNMGAIWWGTQGDVSPHFFRWGEIICHVPPTFFSLGFVYGEVSKIKLMLVTFCVKSFLC